MKNTAKAELSKLQVTPNQNLDTLLDKLDSYEHKRLYASVVQRILHSTPKDTYEVLDTLISLGILKRNYQIKIRDNFLPEEFQNLSDLPESIFDEDQGYDIPVRYEDNVFIFYRVNYNG